MNAPVIQQKPLELNMIYYISLIFTIFYFFPTNNATKTTTWFNIASLVILSLMGITFAFKNVVNTSQKITFKNIALYVLLPFTTVIIIPIVTYLVQNKYREYYEKTQQSISAIDTVNAVVTTLFILQQITLYTLYGNFITNQNISLLQPAILFVLFVLNASLVLYEYVIVSRFITNG